MVAEMTVAARVIMPNLNHLVFLGLHVSAAVVHRLLKVSAPATALDLNFYQGGMMDDPTCGMSENITSFAEELTVTRIERARRCADECEQHTGFGLVLGT